MSNIKRIDTQTLTSYSRYMRKGGERTTAKALTFHEYAFYHHQVIATPMEARAGLAKRPISLEADSYLVATLPNITIANITISSCINSCSINKLKLTSNWHNLLFKYALPVITIKISLMLYLLIKYALETSYEDSLWIELKLLDQ